MKRYSIKPELVACAGDWPSLHAAIDNGADSVYFGLKVLNMRGLATNFDISELSKIMKLLHSNKKKGYLALNTIVLDKDLDKIKKIMQRAKRAKIDAVILWDMAALFYAKKLGLRVHLSTQASVANKEAFAFFAKLGVKRIVLARECTLPDIKAIKAKRLPCEIETFIHGAMCVSISGRCFLSEHSFGKSANKGECLQPCRREYLITDIDKQASYRLGKDYLLSPKDICSIDFIDQLIKTGINAFKIEGRMKSPEYVRVVTASYREAIDAYFDNKLTDALKKKLKKKLKSVYNRGFSEGFFLGVPLKKMSEGLQHTHKKIFVGRVTRFFKKISVAQIKVLDHALSVGDTIIFIGKHTPSPEAKVGQIECEHKPRKRASRGDEVGVKLPFTVRNNDKVFLWKKINNE